MGEEDVEDGEEEAEDDVEAMKNMLGELGL